MDIIGPLLAGVATLAASPALTFTAGVDAIQRLAEDGELRRRLGAAARRKVVLIKDHTYSSAAGRFTLSVLDELGNRRFGIPSPRNYQKRWSWFPCLEENGFRRMDRQAVGKITKDGVFLEQLETNPSQSRAASTPAGDRGADGLAQPGYRLRHLPRLDEPALGVV